MAIADRYQRFTASARHPGDFIRILLQVFPLLLGLGAMLPSHAVDAALQARIDAQIKQAQEWAAAPAIVTAVKARNSGEQPAGMTQDAWEALTVLDPVVRGYTRNAAAEQRHRGTARQLRRGQRE